MLICYLKQVSNWANPYYLQYTESSPLLLCRYIYHRMQRDKIDISVISYISYIQIPKLLKKPGSVVRNSTQHYLEFHILDTQVLSSPVSLVGTLLTWLALLKTYPSLPSHLKMVHALNSVVATQCWDKKQLKHSKTANAVASPTMKSFSPLPTLLQMELKFSLIKGQISA